MPLPAWVTGFLIVNIGGAVIDALLNPDPTADSDLDSVFPDRPKPINPNNPRTNPNENFPTQPNNGPIVYYPPTRIYEIPGLDNINRPELPPRRLPLEGDDQSAIETGLGDVFTIQEWIQHREFGKLLWNPLKDDPLIIRQGFNKDANVLFQEAVSQGLENYRRWLFAQLSPNYKKSEEYLERYSFWDGTAWVMPEQLKGLQGDLAVNFGMKALQRLGNVMSLQSKNCLYGIVDCIPNGYEIRLAEFPEAEQLTNKLDNLEFTGDQITHTLLGVKRFPVTVPKDFTRLPTFDEFLQAGVDERQLDNDSFNSNEDNRLDIDVNNLTPEELEENLGKEYKEKYYDEVHSIIEFVSWEMQQLERLIGAFPIKIDIEDTDLLTEGNQTEQVKFPNLSETLAELMGNSINQEKFTDALMQINLRLLLELGSIKSFATVNNVAIESIVDYLGFSIERTEREIDYTFNPTLTVEEGEDLELEQLLQASKVKISVEDYDDEVTLESQLQELREAAKIIKGAFTRKVNLNDNEGLKTLFKAGLSMLDNNTNGEGNTRLDDWLEKFEEGFTKQSNIKDPNNPWGKDRSQRPRIRKLGNNG